MTKEMANAIRRLTINQAKKVFEQDFGDYDVDDDDYILEKEKLDAYCEGVEDVLKILG